MKEEEQIMVGEGEGGGMGSSSRLAPLKSILSSGWAIRLFVTSLDRIPGKLKKIRYAPRM